MAFMPVLTDTKLYAITIFCLIAVVPHVNATDQIPKPPAREAFLSPGGCYEFVISMNGEAQEWISSGSSGALFRNEGGEAELLWSEDLPHAYRPRFAFVNDDGFVVLLDQWINVAGPHAVTVIDRSGTVIASHDFYDIADTVGIAGRDIIPQAKHGSWMSSKPHVDADNGSVRVSVGTKNLAIRFDSGHLAVEPD